MKDCLFCKIVRGEVPSSKIYEDEESYAFLDIHPVNPGHTLVIPKEHAENIFTISESSWASVARTVQKLASAIEKAMDAHGINLAMNNREPAGQVIHHAHVHIIPRFKNDGYTHWKHKSYKEGEAELVQQKITNAI